MSARVLPSGVLHKPPTRRTSKNGRAYLIASVRDGNGPDAKWWTVFVFSEFAIEELEALVEGDAIAASGSFEASIWAPEGREPRVNLSLTADAILSAHRKPKPRAAKAKPDAPPARSASSAGPAPAPPWPDDEIPF